MHWLFLLNNILHYIERIQYFSFLNINGEAHAQNYVFYLKLQM